MRDRAVSRQPALTIPFYIRGYDGHVSVFYGVNTDPPRWGFRLFELPFDTSLVEGFPVCQAEIAYPGEGYYAFMGWIQVVTVTESTGRVWASVDVAPMLAQTDSPFADFGYRPTMFDAPGPNPPRSDESWVAETFLAIVPDVARSRRVRAVLGFRWGYSLKDMRACPLAIEVAGESDWQRCLGTLRDQYPAWEFDLRFQAK